MAYLRQVAVQDAALKIAGECPCKGCVERTVGCSSSCSRYTEWKQRIHDAREEIMNGQRGEVDATACRQMNFASAVKKHKARETAWGRKNKPRRYT